MLFEVTEPHSVCVLCLQFGTLLHELGHAIGFWHEHSRPDRDDFIRVHKERVRVGEEFNFKVESWGELDNMNVPYDVSSIMHYGSTVSVTLELGIFFHFWFVLQATQFYVLITEMA